MKRIALFLFLFVSLLIACAPAVPAEETVSRGDTPQVIVYRAPT